MRKKNRGEKSERGQSFMELAISIVFLLILLSALIDLGWAYYTMISLRDTVQEAAVYASMCPPHSTDPTDPADPNFTSYNYGRIITRLKRSANAPIDINDVNDVNACVIDPASPHDCAYMNANGRLDPSYSYSVRVEATLLHHIRTPFVASFINQTDYPLSVNVSDQILRLHDEDCHYP